MGKVTIYYERAERRLATDSAFLDFLQSQAKNGSAGEFC